MTASQMLNCRQNSWESNTVCSTIHKSVFLGVHEVTDMSGWQLQEEETSVTFPHISDAMSQGILGNLTKVSFQVRHESLRNLLFFYFNLSQHVQFFFSSNTIDFPALSIISKSAFISRPGDECAHGVFEPK